MLNHRDHHHREANKHHNAVTAHNAISVNNAVTLLLVLAIVTSAAVAAMTLRGGGSKACAVCKYQRRRCTKDCLLAPYFPSDEPQVFHYAHRLFGVSNILKILNYVPPDHRNEAMRSIKYESFIRAKFPVHGCCEVICLLRLQLEQATTQLRQFHGRIAALKTDQFRGKTSEKTTHPMMMTTTTTTEPFPSNGGYNSHFAYAEPFHTKPHPRDDHHVVQCPSSNLYDHNNNDNVNCDEKSSCSSSSSWVNSKSNTKSDTICSPQEFLARQEIDITRDFNAIISCYHQFADNQRALLPSKQTCML